MPSSDYDLFREYEDFGANEGLTAGHFQDWLELYRYSGSTQEDPEADQEMFFQFMNAFMPETGQSHTREFWEDLRELYYDLSGITEEDIDWEGYRQAIGYGKSIL